MVTIRLSRRGRVNLPYYRIGVFDSRMKRDGKCIEFVGSYDPLEADETKKYKVEKERIEYWISVGAQPSTMVWNIIRKHGIHKKKK